MPKENFFSIVPIEGRWMVRKHIASTEETEYYTQVFPNPDAAEKFIIRETSLKPIPIAEKGKII